MKDAEIDGADDMDGLEKSGNPPGIESSHPLLSISEDEPVTELGLLHQELERMRALLEAQAGMLSVDQVVMLMAAKDDMIASRDERIADLKGQLDARNQAETDLRKILSAEQVEKQRLLQAQLFHQAETELRHLAATDTAAHPKEPTAAQKLKKRLVEIGMAIGILMLSWPHITNTYAQLQQWELQRSETPTQAVPSKESQSMFAGAAKPAKSGATAGDASPAASYADAVASMRLVIPRLQLDKRVVEGVSDSDLMKSVGHYPDTALPGEEGNCVIAGHRNIWGSEFAHLDQLQPGDTVKVSTLDRSCVYRVTGKNIVSPMDTSSLEPHGNQQELTLLTCTTPATHRIVVHAVLQSDQPVPVSAVRQTSRRST